MSPDEGTRAEHTRFARLAPVWLAAGLLASAPWTWWRSYAATLESGGDGALYLICARNLLAGEGYTYLGEPFVVRPPGFSVLLAPLLAVFGFAPTVLTLAVWLSGVLAVVLLFAFARPRVGTLLAFAIAVCAWLNPFVRVLANQIMSDLPGVAAMFALLLFERRARRAAGVGPTLLVGLGIGLAGYLRTVNVLLAPALVLARALAPARFADATRPAAGARTPTAPARFALLRLAPLLLVPWLVQLPWSLRNAAGAPEGRAEHTLLHSYAVAQWQTDISDPTSPRISAADLAGRVEERVRDVAGALGSRMARRAPEPSDWAVLGVVLVAGCVGLARRRGPAEFLAAGVFAVTVLYFGFMIRLVLPLYLLGLVIVAGELADLLARRVSRGTARGVVAAGVLALGLVDLGGGAAQRREGTQRGFERFEAACAEVQRALPAPIVLGSSQAHHFALFLERDVYPYRWALVRDGVEGARAYFVRHGIEGLVLSKSWSGDRELRAALGDELEVAAEVGPWIVGRLR